MALPVTGYLSNAARTVAEMKTALEDVRDVASILLGGSTPESKTLSGGTTDPAGLDSGGVLTLDTEAAASTDDCDTIGFTNLHDGAWLLVQGASAARVVTLKHGNGGSGEMLMDDATDFALDATDKWMLFERSGTAWVERLREYGVDNAGFRLYHNVIGMQAGQCRFDYTSTTECTLSRYDGAYIYIDGKWELIPSAGVTLGLTGLSATTFYYVYVYMNAGTMTLEGSATVPTADTTYGHQIKTGDSTRTLVGLIRTTSVPEFFEDGTGSYVLSWFNRKRRAFTTNPTSNPQTTTSTTGVYVTGTRVFWINWGEDDVLVHFGAYLANGTAAGNSRVRVLNESAGAIIGSIETTSTAVDDGQCASASAHLSLAEGSAVRSAEIDLRTSSGGTAKIYSASTLVVEILG